LRRRDFRLVFISSTISVIGDRFAFIALPFAVLAAGGSAGDVGIIIAAETLSRGAFLLPGGVVADRARRARVMVAADVVRAGTQAGLAALIITGPANLALLVALQAVHGAASAFFDPASTGLVADVVPSDELQPANAQLSISRGLATFIGPALAGYLVAWYSAGVALWVDSATFVVSAVFLLGVSAPERVRDEREPQQHVLHDLRIGFRELWVRPWLVTIMSASGISLMAIFGTLFVLGPSVADAELGGSDSWGLVVGVFGLGSVLGGIVALRVPARRQVRAIFSVALITVPGILLLAVPAPIPVLAAAFLGAGIAMSYAGTVYEVVLQQWIPSAILARIASYDWLVTTVLSSVGLVLAGWFADEFGEQSTLIGAAAVLTVAVAVPLVSRTVRRADASHARRVPQPPSPPKPVVAAESPASAEPPDGEVPKAAAEPRAPAASRAATDPAARREPLLVLPDPPEPHAVVLSLPDPPPAWARRPD
jgi:MFS family permease